MQIAVDGPAGAGKSTVAKMIAKKYKILYLDTGAMYRAVGLKTLHLGIDPQDKDSVESIMEDIDISIKYVNDSQRVILDNVDVTDMIRTPEVSMAASNVSKWPKVRIALVDMQRAIAAENDVIMDGRDIASYVLPNADFKFYITASSRIRAYRRQLQLNKKNEIHSLDELEQEIIIRDKQDMTREFAPLIVAKDAIVIDTSNIDANGVIEKVINIIETEK